jgi:integrase
LASAAVFGVEPTQFLCLPGLAWVDLLYREELIAVRAKLKGGKVRYVPMTPELAAELRRYPAMIGADRVFPPKPGAKGARQRVEGSFETILKMAGIEDFRFHDLRHTFASWYMTARVKHFETPGMGIY